MELDAAGSHSGQERPVQDQLALLRTRVRTLEGSRRELETHLAEKQLALEHAQLTIREQQRELEKLRRIQAERACEETAELEPLHGPAPHAAAAALDKAQPQHTSSGTHSTASLSSSKSKSKTSRISARSRARQRMESKTGTTRPVIPVPDLEDDEGEEEEVGPPMTGQELVKRSGVMPSFRLEKAVSALSGDAVAVSGAPGNTAASARKAPSRWTQLLWAAVFAAIASGAVWLLFQLIRKEPYDQDVSPRVQQAAPEEVQVPSSPPREARPAVPSRSPTPEAPQPAATPPAPEPIEVAASGGPTLELESPDRGASPGPSFDAQQLQRKAEKALDTNDAFLFEELMRDFSRIGSEEFEALLMHIKQNSKHPKLAEFVKTLYAKVRDGREPGRR